MIRKEVIGDCTLYLGDCREVLPTLGKVDAVVTSPPYAMQRNYGQKIDDWRSLMKPICGVKAYEQTQILVNLGLVHRDGEVQEYWEGFISDMRADGWRLFGWYVWDQGSGLPGEWNGRLAPSFEFVFHFNRNARAVNKTKPTLGGKQSGPNLRAADGSQARKSQHGRLVQPTKIPDAIIRATRELSSDFSSEHPARFSVAFATELTAPFTDAGDTVLDPFLGSGTTGVACVKLGRKFIGVEIEPKYFDIACRRIEAAYAQPDLFVPRPESKPEQLTMGAI